MFTRNLLAFMLIGTAAMLIYVALAPKIEAPDDESTRTRSTEAPTEIDDSDLAPRKSRITWASWRKPGASEEVEIVSRPLDEKPMDPRLEKLMEGLKGVDVYVQGVNDDD